MIPQCNPKASYLANKSKIDKAITRALNSGWYILGKECKSFEKEFADYLGVSYTLGVASGTDAIELALRVCGVSAGDKVLTVSHTAVATVSAISRIGALPTFVDINQEYTLDPEHLKQILSSFDEKEFSAIIVVHLYGQVADMPTIKSIAEKYGIPVIEDCAQAHGASLNNKKAGTFGDVSCFSFYPTKNLGALGDGGMVATNNQTLNDDLILLRQYGWRDRYVSEVPGLNSRLDELQAAILRVKLLRLEEDNDERKKHAVNYTEQLSNVPLELPKIMDGCDHVFHQYVIQCDNRDEIHEKLEKKGVLTAIHYPLPVHKQPAYSSGDYRPFPLVNTEEIMSKILSLPMYPELTEDQVNEVCNQILELFT